jgi:hypothetical protein
MDEVLYSGPVVLLTEDAPAAETVITVFATTETPPEIRIDRVDWIIDDQPGALLILQLYYFGSDGDRTFIGAPVNGVNLPATAAIHLPPGADQVIFEGGVVGGRFQQQGDLYYDIAPLIPGAGTKQIVVRYLLPYDGTAFTFTQEYLYPLAESTLLVAELPALQATIAPREGAAWEPVESQEFQGRTYSIYHAEALPATEIVVEMNGLLSATDPDPRVATDVGAGATSSVVITPLVPWMAWSIGGLGAVMLFVGLVWARRGGRMELATRSVDLRQEVDALARRIAQLDDRHALGQVETFQWQQQRGQLKARLLQLAQQIDANSP